MHNALLVNEILREITQWVATDTDSPTGRASLAALAATSRALSDIALDELWMSVDAAAIYGLVQLVPKPLWELELKGTTTPPTNAAVVDCCQMVLRFKDTKDGTLTGDWIGERFRNYSHRIRSCRISCFDLFKRKRMRATVEIDDSIFAAWSTYAAKDLFPKITTISMTIKSRAALPFALNLLMCPVKVLKWNFCSSDIDSDAVLAELFHQPQLCDLTLSYGSSRSGFRPRISILPIVQTCMTLRSLTIHRPLGVDVFLSIAALPSLQSCNLILLEVIPATKQPKSFFPALTKLEITVSRTSTLMSILDVYKTSALRTFRAIVIELSSIDDLEHVARLIGAGSFRQSILDIHIKTTSPYDLRMVGTTENFSHIIFALLKTSAQCIELDTWFVSDDETLNNLLNWVPTHVRTMRVMLRNPVRLSTFVRLKQRFNNFTCTLDLDTLLSDAEVTHLPLIPFEQCRIGLVTSIMLPPKDLPPIAQILKKFFSKLIFLTVTVGSCIDWHSTDALLAIYNGDTQG